MFTRVRIVQAMAVGALLAGCGSAAPSGSPVHKSTATPTAISSATAKPTALATSSASVDVTVTGPLAVTVTAYSNDVADARCAPGTDQGSPAFDAVAVIGAGTADVGDSLIVSLLAPSGGPGAVYSGPGTYQVNYQTQPESAATNVVGILQPNGTVVLEAWEASVTVNSDQTSASFTGTYGVPGSGYVNSGTISGSVTCIPGAAQP